MPNQTVMILIAVLITLVIAVPVSCLAAVSYRKKIVEIQTGQCGGKGQTDHRRCAEDGRDQETRSTSGGEGRIFEDEE